MSRRPGIKKPRIGEEIVIYQTKDGGTALEVRLERETIWLTQPQMAKLFEKERSVITKHLRNIFREGELSRDSVSAFFAHTAADGKTYQVERYNLDAIISVGYRVNSKRGTQFRIWATRILKEHLVKGYTANEQRLKELKQTLSLASGIARRRALSADEASALLAVVGDYSQALDLLDDYDHERVTVAATTQPAETAPVTYEEAHRVVEKMRETFGASALFGKEKDKGLHASLAAIMQTAGGTEAYPSLEEKAAHLLYFLVKNHPFVDGNKRIGAALFLWFLEKNHALYRANGSKRIADNALVAMTLLIAESKPQDKDLLCRVLVNLINKRNP